MLTVRTITDINEGQEVWRALIPPENIADLWEVRSCFHRYYQRPINFIVAEENGTVCGFLPLCYIGEKDSLAYFPGETWKNTTWLEQNRIIAADKDVFSAMLRACSKPYHLRYLSPQEGISEANHIVDEIGYLFNPPQYAYDIENYFKAFSHKSEKRLKKELNDLERLGVTYRYDQLADFDHLVDLNIERFGFESYFFDARFRESFRCLMHLFRDQGWLRITTIAIDGIIAAIDLGCMYRGKYTLLAGGTNGQFPGIAKLINTHHMRYACEKRFDQVDFLCGDFAWKKLFHLTSRPLYLLSNVPVAGDYNILPTNRLDDLPRGTSQLGR